jgi:acyl carrier protein
MYGFLPGLNWPTEAEEISPEIGNGISSGVTAAVTSLLRKRPDWDGVLNPKISLMKTGLIDSIGLIELVQELQDKFSVHIFPEEVNETNFNTIGSICRLIHEKLTVSI